MKKILILCVCLLLISCQTLKENVWPAVKEAGQNFHEFNERFCAADNLMRHAMLTGIRIVSPAYPADGWYCKARESYLQLRGWQDVQLHQSARLFGAEDDIAANWDRTLHNKLRDLHYKFCAESDVKAREALLASIREIAPKWPEDGFCENSEIKGGWQ